MKDFDRVWHQALWATVVTIRMYNINASVIYTIIEDLYNKAKRAVLFSDSTGDWFRCTVGFQRGKKVIEKQ